MQNISCAKIVVVVVLEYIMIEIGQQTIVFLTADA
jgi:hypothetical protein